MRFFICIFFCISERLELKSGKESGLNLKIGIFEKTDKEKLIRIF